MVHFNLVGNGDAVYGNTNKEQNIILNAQNELRKQKLLPKDKLLCVKDGLTEAGKHALISARDKGLITPDSSLDKFVKLYQETFLNNPLTIKNAIRTCDEGMKSLDSLSSGYQVFKNVKDELKKGNISLDPTADNSYLNILNYGGYYNLKFNY